MSQHHIHEAGHLRQPHKFKRKNLLLLRTHLVLLCYIASFNCNDTICKKKKKKRRNEKKKILKSHTLYKNSLKMDHKTIKHLEKNRRKSPWPTVRPTVLRHDTKRTIHEEKNDKLNLLKFKNLKKKKLCERYLSREWNDRLQTERKYLQIIKLTNDCISKVLAKLDTKKTKTELKYGPKTGTGTSWKRIYRWQINIQKDV